MKIDFWWNENSGTRLSQLSLKYFSSEGKIRNVIDRCKKQLVIEVFFQNFNSQAIGVELQKNYTTHN